MKLSIALFFALVPMIAADPPAAKAAAPAKTAPAKAPAPAKAAAPAAVTIPAGAVETEPGTFRFTDGDGKKWIYRKTPFGVARAEDKGGETPSAGSTGLASTTPKADVAANAANKEQPVQVVEQGDTVHFERPGPFGIYKWDRKKDELSDAERGWLEQQRARSSAQASNK